MSESLVDRGVEEEYNYLAVNIYLYIYIYIYIIHDSNRHQTTLHEHSCMGSDCGTMSTIISLHTWIQTWLISPIIRACSIYWFILQTELSLAFLNRRLYVWIIYFYMVPLREHNLLYLFAICCAMLYLIRRIGPMHFSGSPPSQCLPGGRPC